jgi:LacI family transcriptional regulator, repressor for deo operon, udp, cdd, tsx, nupC, and nupG
MRPTLSDVAKMAGVSVATASRALSNPDLVADSTRRAVRDAAESCGYKVNLVARSLRIQRTNTLLVLQPCIDQPFYPALLRSIEETALAAGYSVMVGFTDKPDKYREAYADLLSNGRVDGVIIVDGGTGVDGFTGPKPDVPAVQVLDVVYGGAVPAVRVDDHYVAEVAVHHLASLGHRRIAHIAGREKSLPSADRRKGFLAAMAKLGLAVDEDLVRPGNSQRDGAAEAMRHFLSLPKPPTAVFCASDAMACAAMDVCRDRGLQVPGDISFVGADDTADAQFNYPALTTVHVPRSAIGARAVEKLIGLIRGQSGIPHDTVMPVELKLRGTHAPLRSAAAA